MQHTVRVVRLLSRWKIARLAARSVLGAEAMRMTTPLELAVQIVATSTPKCMDCGEVFFSFRELAAHECIPSGKFPGVESSLFVEAAQEASKRRLPRDTLRE
jgi:hypothetical protein